MTENNRGREKHLKFDSVTGAIHDVAEGRLVIVTDDESRENEGDLIMAASKATPETVNMMIRYGSGIICVPTTDTHLRRLGINPMVQQNRESHGTDFAVSVDAAMGITTGISAYDRTLTISILSDPNATPDKLVQPGHVFPLRARPGGVLERAGHTEAAVDLAVLAGLPPSGVLCEILNDDGTCARLPELIEFKSEFGLKMISIADLIEYRRRREQLVECIAKDALPTSFGEFDLRIYENRIDRRQYIVLSLGKLDASPTLVRVHAENLLGDVFEASEMGSRYSLVNALTRIGKEGQGVIVYITKPHGGVHILKDGIDSRRHRLTTAGMDFRDFGIGAQILVHLGLRKIRILSGTPRRYRGLEGYGLEIVEQIPLTHESR